MLTDDIAFQDRPSSMAQGKLCCSITLDQIDAYFALKDVPKGRTVPGLVFNGRPLDPKTKQPLMVEEEYQPKSRFKQSRNQHDLPSGGPGSLYMSAYGEDESSVMESSVAPGDMQQLETDTLPELTYLNINVANNHDDPSNLEVYRHYDFDHRNGKLLPVHNHREEIIKAIEDNEVTIIQGRTGCGKSTQVPQFILDEFKSKMKYCNVVITQPRKIAATSIARRVSHERNWQLGQLVGYQVGLDKCISEDTRITYMTVGVLLKQLIKEKDLNKYTHIILDEVHERDQETDFALLVVRRFLRWNSKSVKVILMSATFDTNEFAKYFSTVVTDKSIPAPVVSVQGRSYEVKEHFVEELDFLGTLPKFDCIDPDISDEAFILAAKLIKYFDVHERKELEENDQGPVPASRGAVLVFLPGLFYIRELEQILDHSRVDSKLMIIPLHSTITLEEQSQVFATPKGGLRKVILATNIAESSITVPDIKYVIDFCLTKSLVCDVDTNYQSLRLQWASKANGIQRKGRAGRVSHGHVYRMVTKFFWNSNISDYGMPEMERCPLEHTVLQVKLLDLGEPKAILSLALSPPRLESIERTVLLLKEIGALSSIGHACRHKYDGDLTFVGRVLASLPLDMRLGKMLLLGYVFGCLEDCVVIAASLSKGSFLATPYREILKAYRFRLQWAGGSFSDCIAYRNAYRAWESAVNTQRFQKKRDEYIWCKNNFIQPRRIHEVHMLVKEIADRLRNFNIRSSDQWHWESDMPEHRELILKVVMSGAFYPNYLYTSGTDEKVAMKEICGLDPYRTILLTGLPSGRGPLYSQSLQFALKECGKQKALHFDGSKALLQFCEEFDEKLITGKVLPSVYIGCRMKSVRQRLQIVQSHSETPQSSQLSRPFLIDVINCDGFHKEIPKPGGPTSMPIHITHVVSVCHFWGCKAGESHFKLQQTLFHGIQKAARTGESFTGVVEPNTLVLAPFSDGSGTWFYRALVQKRIGNRAWVFYVDYGNCRSNVDVSSFKKVPPMLSDIPFQAVEFALCGIRPLETMSHMTGKNELESMLLANENRCKVTVYSVVSNRTRVDLFTLDNVHVNSVLVDKGYAEKCEESLLSQKNHREWECAEYHKIKSEEDFAKFYNSDWRTIPDAARGPLLPHAHRKMPVKLYGPSSPLEVGCNSMINIGQLRNVKIERDSVNSVIINQDPADECRDLVIAASVRVNDGGDTMIAMNTTLLPRIHGLPFMVAMLFAPVMELRTDENRTRLTGAICGLGAVKNRFGNFSILPEHDMEMAFDVEITTDDIIRLNSLRMIINMAVGSSEEIASWSPSAIHELQKSARQKLCEIFNKQRPKICPESFKTPYKWDQIDDRFLLPHDIDHRSADKKDLYRLHDAILLNPR